MKWEEDAYGDFRADLSLFGGGVDGIDIEIFVFDESRGQDENAHWSYTVLFDTRVVLEGSPHPKSPAWTKRHVRKALSAGLISLLKYLSEPENE